MDMMLQSQIENKSINLVVGEDYKEFCRSVIEEYMKSKSKIYQVLNYLQKYLIWMVLITLLMLLVNGMTSITVNQFLLANMVSLISIPISRKESQENASTAPLPFYKRIYFKRDLGESAIWILAAGIVMMLFSYITEDKLGLNINNYKISFSYGIPYLILIIMIIGAIEIYKRISDMKQQL